MTPPTALTPEEQADIRTVEQERPLGIFEQLLLAIIHRLDAECVKTQAIPMCGTCGGVPPSSGKPCVCGGRNTIFAEAQGLREECFRLDAIVRELEGNNKRLQQTLALHEGPHSTMDVSYANELEQAYRDAHARFQGEQAKSLDLIRERDAFQTREARLREALTRLRAEISDLHIAAVRDGLGNTNAAVLQLRAQEADAALAEPPG